jgi:hypothetical protein
VACLLCCADVLHWRAGAYKLRTGLFDDEAFTVRESIAEKIRGAGSVVLSADGYTNFNGESIYVCTVMLESLLRLLLLLCLLLLRLLLLLLLQLSKQLQLSRAVCVCRPAAGKAAHGKACQALP